LSKKDLSKKEKGFVNSEDVLQRTPNNLVISTVVQPLFDKLHKQGFEQNSTDSITDTVSVNLLLNKPLSLSSRKNNLLVNELNSEIDNPKIRHNKFGIFWKFNWYDKSNKIVKYGVVRTFYKKLKRYNKNKADEFRLHVENSDRFIVPYQELRELAKNHETTKELIRKTRQECPGSDVYLSIIDGDTVSFNGIYSAYLRIHANRRPTIMSTGYIFSLENQGDTPFVRGSELDRKIRVATAEFVKLGVYIPEPNFCILVPNDLDTLEESFVDKERKNCNAESAVLIRNLIKSRGIDELTVIFSSDNPIITTRARNI
jgi:hypothetical protein